MYDPDPNVHVPEDSFEYAVFVCPPNGFMSTASLVTIQVASVKDSPIAIPFHVNATENEGTHLTLMSMDVDKEDLIIYIVTSLPRNGRLYKADFDDSSTVGEE